MKIFWQAFWLLFSVATGMVGYNVNVHNHSSFPLFWSIVDGIFCIFSWAKWLICHDVTQSLIRDTFSFFFN